MMEWFIWGNEDEGKFPSEQAAIERAWELTPAGGQRPLVEQAVPALKGTAFRGWPVEPELLVADKSYPLDGSAPLESVREGELLAMLRKQATERGLTFEEGYVVWQIDHPLHRIDYHAEVMARPLNMEPPMRPAPVQLESVKSFAKGSGIKEATMMETVRADLQAQAATRGVWFSEEDITWETIKGLVSTKVTGMVVCHTRRLARGGVVQGSMVHISSGGTLTTSDGRNFDMKDIWARAKETPEKYRTYDMGHLHIERRRG